jgi:predicted DNA-binding protein YlxM (UPF0122 family)
MFNLKVKVRPSISDVLRITEITPEKRNRNSTVLYTLLADVGYRTDEIANFFNVKKSAVSVGKSRFKSNKYNYKLINPLYKKWVKQINDEIIRKCVFDNTLEGVGIVDVEHL